MAESYDPSHETNSTVDVIQTLNRYCLYFDNAAIEPFIALWAEECELLITGLDPVVGRQAIKQWATVACSSGKFMHFVSNTVVDYTQTQQCRARSYVTAFRQVEPGAAHITPSLLGKYDDNLVLLDGRWIFQRRVITFFARPPVRNKV